MELYYSELCCIGGSVMDNIQRLSSAGTKHIELMLDGKGWDEFHLCKEAFIAQIIQKPLHYSVHTPVWDINLTSENDAARQAALLTYRQSISLAAQLHAKHVVLHPGFCYSAAFDKATARKRARESLESLCEWNRRFGCLLLVENVGNRATSIFTQQEYTDFILSLG